MKNFLKLNDLGITIISNGKVHYKGALIIDEFISEYTGCEVTHRADISFYPGKEISTEELKDFINEEVTEASVYYQMKKLEEIQSSKKIIEREMSYYKSKIKGMKELIKSQEEYLKNVSEKINEDTLEGFLRKNYYRTQAFDTRNFVGDKMITVYNKNNIQVDYAPDYDYIEIFGISREEFVELQEKGVIT